MVRTPVIASLVLGALVASPAAAKDKATLVLQPSSQWQLDMGEHRCRLARTFGTGASETLFYIEQFNPSDHFSWAVAGPPLDDLDIASKYQRSVTDRTLDVQFGPAVPSWEMNYRDASLGKFGNAVMEFGPEGPTEKKHIGDGDDDEAAAEVLPTARQLNVETGKAIEWLSLYSKRIGNIRLALGNMEAPYKAMNFCMDDLVKSWGLDPAEQKGLQKSVDWLNAKDVVQALVFPQKALWKGSRAQFSYRIIVDDTGQPESCTMTGITTEDGFDGNSAVCSLIMRRAKFAPAVGRDGNPVRSYYASKMIYDFAD